MLFFKRFRDPINTYFLELKLALWSFALYVFFSAFLKKVQRHQTQRYKCILTGNVLSSSVQDKRQQCQHIIYLLVRISKKYYIHYTIYMLRNLFFYLFYFTQNK
jgi:hypothetical protein